MGGSFTPIAQYVTPPHFFDVVEDTASNLPRNASFMETAARAFLKVCPLKAVYGTVTSQNIPLFRGEGGVDKGLRWAG